MNSLHEIQLGILQSILFAPSQRYSDMKPQGMEGSKFTFHLDKLVEGGLILKASDGSYHLTVKGKEFANQMDAQEVRMRKQAKITLKLCCVRKGLDGDEYLIYTRKKNPFYGLKGFPNSKVWYGKNLQESANQGLFDETNLHGEGRLFAIRHYVVCDQKSKEVLEDKMVYMYRFEAPEGDLVSKKDGEFEWVNVDALARKENVWLPEFDEVLRLLQNRGEGDFFKEVSQDIDVHIF